MRNEKVSSKALQGNLFLLTKLPKTPYLTFNCGDSHPTRHFQHPSGGSQQELKEMFIDE
jgi:hypothetical protein